MAKPILLHLGDDIRWNHELYEKLEERFDIKRSHSMNRTDFKAALEAKQFGDFVAMYRPFWSTGGEMGNWDEELMYARYCADFWMLSHIYITNPAHFSPLPARFTPAQEQVSIGSTQNAWPSAASSTAMLRPHARNPLPIQPYGSF